MNYQYSSFSVCEWAGATNLDREFIYSFVDKDVFEGWHDQKRMESEYLQEFIQDYI